MVLSFDPALNLIYVGTSVTSPAPKFMLGGADRKHLYHNSTLALDAEMSLVATGGGLVFGGDVNGRFKAWDQETGEVLWEINLGSAVTGFPISYAVDGRQYIAVGTGTASTASLFGRLTPEIRPSAGNNLFVFALPD